MQSLTATWPHEVLPLLTLQDRPPSVTAPNPVTSIAGFLTFREAPARYMVTRLVSLIVDTMQSETTIDEVDTSAGHLETALSRRRVTGLLGVMYLLGAALHIGLGLFAPESYEQFADRALHVSYTQLWRTFIVPNLSVLQPSVIALEAGIGLALLWRGRKFGHAAGGMFQLALVPSGPWGPINLLLAAIHWFGLRASSGS